MKKRFDSFLKFLQTLSLRVTLALLFFVLLMIQGLIAFLTRFQDPNILVLSSILTLVVGIITSSLLTSLTDDWKVNRERQEILKQAAEAFQNKNRATFDHIATQFLEFYNEHRRIKLAKDIPRFSEWYFEWMAQEAQSKEWSVVFEKFGPIDQVISDYPPLAALIHFADRLDDPTQLDSLLACLTQLPTPANLKLLQYHRQAVKQAAATNKELNERLFVLALSKMAEADGDAKYVIEELLGKKLPSESLAKAPSWFEEMGLDESKLDCLKNRSEQEPDDFAASEFVVALETNLLPNLASAKKHVAVIGAMGEGKTFHKKQFHSKCRADATCLYVEWKAWKDAFQKNSISIEELRKGFMADFYGACQAHSKLNGRIENDTSAIETYKAEFGAKEIERVYLVMDLGNAARFPHFEEEHQGVKTLFAALPRDEMFSGHPEFYLRLFLDYMLLQGVRTSQSLFGSDSLRIDEINLRWDILIFDSDPKRELVEKRLNSLFQGNADKRRWESLVWEPEKDAAGLSVGTTLPEEIAKEFNTPREIVRFLRELLIHKAKLYANSPTTLREITRQEYESFLKEYPR